MSTILAEFSEGQRIAHFDLLTFVDSCLSHNVIYALSTIFHVRLLYAAGGTFKGVPQIMIGARDLHLFRSADCMTMMADKSQRTRESFFLSHLNESCPNLLQRMPLRGPFGKSLRGSAFCSASSSHHIRQMHRISDLIYYFS
jgi:hypothetical protein